MLSIGAASGGYYASLAVEDYYHAGGEPPGVWAGQVAKDLCLLGQVNKELFLKLCDGFSPEGNALVQNAGRENHRAGYDLTFSAPKSVSVLWSQADPETRLEIQRAQQEAVKASLSYLEEVAAITRRGRGGIEQEPCGLIVAMFEHGTSRAQDPQLHTHAVVLNIAVRDDGTTGAIEAAPLFQHKMAGGAVYRTELASQLERRLAVRIVRGVKDTFEIEGIPKDLIEEFSKRRTAIEEAMEKEGARGAARAAHFTLTTREEKEHVAREILFEKWQETGREHGFSVGQVMGQGRGLSSKEVEKESAVEKAVSRITESQAYFTEKDLVRRTAEEGQGRGLSAREVISSARAYLDNEAICLGRINGERLYTTHEIDALEKKMLSQAEASLRLWHEPVRREAVAISPMLNDEQKRALGRIIQEKGAIQVVSGMAGTGKTMLLDSAREIWEAQGYEVRGVALAAVAAKGLQEGAKIESTTIAKMLLDIDKGKVELNSRSVLVIDEAGMVGTRQMARIIDEVSTTGAKLILVGDEKQLQPIEHGAPFKAIGERLGRAELTGIRRQREEWARDAVKDFAEGRAEKGLQSYAERGLLTVSESRKDAMVELICDWANADETYGEKLILTGTKAEAITLNRLAQSSRNVKEELGEISIKVNGETLFENDRVLFTKNSRFYGVNNGDLGTIKRIDTEQGNVTVILDSGERVRIPVAAYQNIQLGYAVTTHKGQGKTKEKAFVLVGGVMDHREFSYVQMSRSRGETRIYTERAEAGDTITELAREMSRSRQKEIAQDVTREHWHRGQEQQKAHEREKSIQR